jgi:hypothetical protein
MANVGASGNDGGSKANSEQTLGTMTNRANDQIKFQEEATNIQDAAQKTLKIFQAILEMLKTLKA